MVALVRETVFFGSIINVGVRKIEPTKKYKKVEHKFEKSVNMELTKNQNGGQKYALHLFYEKITGLQGIIINNIESNEKEVHIHCELERKPHKCPNCGCVTDCVHDYRVQVIKDIPSFGKFIYIHLRKRRYRCKCGKRFAEDNNFLAKYQRYTTRFIIYINVRFN